MTAAEKLQQIVRIANAWRRGGNLCSSDDAMIEILRVLDDTPRASRNPVFAHHTAPPHHASHEAHEEPPRPPTGRRPKRAIRAKSGLLG